MILFPTTPLSDAERRAERILQHGVECCDKQLLSELWCVLGNAEAAQESGSTRKRLHRIREEVGDAIADIESESTRDGPLARNRACG